MSRGFPKSTLIRLAELACIECDSGELQSLERDLTDMSALFDQLSSIDTTDVMPFNLSADAALSPLRGDEPELGLDRFPLQNAPERVGSFICVPPILSKEI